MGQLAIVERMLTWRWIRAAQTINTTSSLRVQVAPLGSFWDHWMMYISIWIHNFNLYTHHVINLYVYLCYFLGVYINISLPYVSIPYHPVYWLSFGCIVLRVAGYFYLKLVYAPELFEVGVGMDQNASRKDSPNISGIEGQLGVPLTYVYPWYFLCSL